ALAVGVTGGVLALADVAPVQCVELYNLARSGDHSAARALQLRLLPVNKAVTGTYGIPGVKAAMDVLGYYGGPPRAPLSPLGAAETETLRGILTTAGLL
ncbi:MAG: dihydrodipicolinate synthase family protein, partial [Actinobacteria bacterium]|nr:dihydrodipicolinate synthase family protein [Actinomycetota bacterium]